MIEGEEVAVEVDDDDEEREALARGLVAERKRVVYGDMSSWSGKSTRVYSLREAFCVVAVKPPSNRWCQDNREHSRIFKVLRIRVLDHAYLELYAQ